MNIVQFAKKNGVSFPRCDSSWGGTWAYKYPDSNSTVAGYKTQKEAAQAWFEDALHDLNDWGKRFVIDLMKKEFE